MTLIGYEGSLANLGQLKRPGLKKDRNLYFDCTTRAFSNKCTNFDALHIMSQQNGYSLIFYTHSDFGRILLCFISGELSVDIGTIYYARFCQLIFNYFP